MFKPKKTVHLSPRLRWGVKKKFTSARLLRYSGVIFLCLTFVVLANAGYKLLKNGQSGSTPNPQVAGAFDTTNSSSNTNNPGHFISYTVKAGDTLFNIGQHYHIDWNILVTLNDLKTIKLTPGQIIKIPNQ